MLELDVQTMIVQPLLGGLLIGIAVTFMLAFNGRVTGISGILNGLLTFQKGDMGWRATFVVGMLAGGLVLAVIFPDAFLNTSSRSLWQIGVAGLLVGFGTVMGSGCTSGHGICGLSRFSIRSLLATLAFMVSGIIVVDLIRRFASGAL